MRIAVLNSWPNLEYSAEREFIARLELACLNLGWTCIEVATSDEISIAEPDCIIVTHEYSPKLTQVPTIGLLWNPPDYFRDDPLRVRNILSYDGYLAGSDSVREYLEDLLFSTNKNSPVSKFDVLPTAPSTEFREPNLSEPSLFYAGVHWDGKRHEGLIKMLCARLPISFYGDPSKWARFGTAYKGRIPFDGKSIFHKINAAGVALCLHRAEHLKSGIPSMRIFESAAASAVVITENSIWAKRHFGDAVLYVDKDTSDSEKAKQVIEHFEWIRSHPSEARILAMRANAIFNEKFSLEKFLGRLPAFLEQVRDIGCFVGTKQEGRNLKVEAIVRIGGRRLSYVERCLDSLAAQSHANLGLILVSYAYIPGIENLLKKYEARFTSIKRINSEATGFRSTSLWDGMRAVDSDFFCNLDDDDTIHPNHISSLTNLLDANKDHHVAYSGCIQVQDEDGHYYMQINFKGSKGLLIKENRRLLFFEPFSIQRMLRLENFVVSNSWVARKELLEERVLVDPRLIVSEDVYLYQLFLLRGDFLFSWTATANWHLRSTNRDNSEFQRVEQAEYIKRIKLRTQFFSYSQNSLTCLDVARPFVSYTWNRFPRIKALFHYIKKLLADRQK